MPPANDAQRSCWMGCAVATSTACFSSSSCLKRANLSSQSLPPSKRMRRAVDPILKNFERKAAQSTTPDPDTSIKSTQALSSEKSRRMPNARRSCSRKTVGVICVDVKPRRPAGPSDLTEYFTDASMSLSTVLLSSTSVYSFTLARSRASAFLSRAAWNRSMASMRWPARATRAPRSRDRSTNPIPKNVRRNSGHDTMPSPSRSNICVSAPSSRRENSTLKTRFNCSRNTNGCISAPSKAVSGMASGMFLSYFRAAAVIFASALALSVSSNSVAHAASHVCIFASFTAASSRSISSSRSRRFSSRPCRTRRFSSKLR
mmetsp:Transcript_18450/g.62225  ORF Transcript_18450/g.62225 Transcript_18450/m.62225 type:complete len:317 (+) Transcript_18450:1067-2017(+)